jgi:hypothetical protein
MLVNEQLMAIMLEEYPDWYRSPEGFLEFIVLFDMLSQILDDFHSMEPLALSDAGEELANVFIGVMGINIYPYADFESLKRAPVSQKGLKEKFTSMLDRMKADNAFHELVADTGLFPSNDTMIREVLKEYFVQDILNRLRPHVDFY